MPQWPRRVICDPGVRAVLWESWELAAVSGWPGSAWGWGEGCLGPTVWGQDQGCSVVGTESGERLGLVGTHSGLAPSKVAVRDLWGSIWRQEEGFHGALTRARLEGAWSPDRGRGLWEVRPPGPVQDPRSAQCSLGSDLRPLSCTVAGWLWVTLREGSRTKRGPAPPPCWGQVGCVQPWPEPHGRSRGQGPALFLPQTHWVTSGSPCPY